MRINPKKFLSGLLYAAPILLLALASCGGGGGGGSTTPTTPVVAPSAPTGLATTTGCSAINLTWNAVAGATSYNVYHAASGAIATTTLVSTNSYTDTGLGVTTTYNYQVTAANSAGVSPKSTPVTQATGSACFNVGGSVQGTPLTLSSSSQVSTIAGAAPFPGYVDSTTGLNARFDLPANVATDGTNLYIADSANNVIRKIVISTGAVSTFAGSLTGASGIAITTTGPGTLASFNSPQGITMSGTNLYVADTKSGTIRTISASGVVATIASGYNQPAAITTDGASLYVADTLNDKIVKLSMDGTTTIATAAVISPQGITYSRGDTDLYVTGASGISQIPTVSMTPTLLTVGGIDTYGPQGITTDGTDLYVTLSTIGTVIRISTPGGTPMTNTIAGTGIAGYKDGTASAAQFRQPYGITTDGANLYIVDTGNSTIRKIH